MLVLGIGIGLPLLVEPGVAAGLALVDAAPARWMLPTTALRAVMEGAVDTPVTLAPIGDGAVAVAVAAIGCWTLLAVAAAWARMRSAQPR